MKRRLLLKTTENESLLSQDIPDNIAEYIAELKLLYHVPLSYLVPDEKLLPAESIRFFCIDETYTDVLADGALSIGRNDTAAARQDMTVLGPALQLSKACGGRLRYDRVHENHRDKLLCGGFSLQKDTKTGFLLRSELVRRRKGIEITGYGAGGRLAMLRGDIITADVMICIFDGTLRGVELAEPKSALRFGTFENDRRIQVKSIVEDETFGRYMDGSEIRLKSDGYGKLDVLAAKEELEKKLGGGRVTPSVFAFQLMLAAQKAVFHAKEEEQP